MCIRDRSESTAADDGEKMEDTAPTKEGPSDSGSKKPSMYPFKIKGMKQFGYTLDEYTITGKGYDGNTNTSYYRGSAFMSSVKFDDPAEKQYISDAIEGRRSIMNMKRDQEIDTSLQGITGTGLQSRSAELQAQRDSYAGGFTSGPQAFVNTTNALSLIHI